MTKIHISRIKKLLAFLLVFSLFQIFGVPAEAASHSSHGFSGNSSISKAIDTLGDKAVKELPVPVLLGVSPSQISDTWNEARAEGRTHEGTDIFAPRGALVVSPTDAVVTSAETNSKTNTLGGTYVFTTNPGGERYYYAHLDKIADGIVPGKVLKTGDLIGYVGNTGDAAGGPTHLHFGIYTSDKSEVASGATNPYPRLKKEFTPAEKMKYLGAILDKADDPAALASTLVSEYRSYFLETVYNGTAIPKQIAQALSGIASTGGTSTSGSSAANSVQTTAVLGSGIPMITSGPARNLTVGMQGDDIKWLQAYLINANKGKAAIALSYAGTTGYFGSLTQAALAEYQTSVGIIPASGTYDAPTKTYLQSIGALSQ